MRNILFRQLILAAAVLALAAASYAQSGKIENIAAQSAQVTEFEVNGLKVLLKRRSASPTVAAGLYIRGGARNITDKNAGIENLMLNSAIEAGKRHPRTSVRRLLAGTGSAIGAAAGPDFSQVSLVSTRQNFDRVWDVFTGVMLEPAFAPDDVDRVRQQIIMGLREVEINPDGALNALQDRVVYAGHPYANDASGTIATISTFSPEDLRAYHRDLMRTSRLLLVVVGDLDAADLRRRVTASFGKLPRGSYKDTPYPALDFSKATLDVAPRNLQTNYVQGVYNAPSLSNPDYYAMRVATTILAQLVNEEVRMKRQLSYAPNAELNNFAANTANIYVTAVDANRAVKVMLDQVNLLKTQPIREDRIAGMAGQFLTNYYLGQERSAEQANELARYELIGGGWRNSFEFLNRIWEVTAADVQAVANKYFKNPRFVVVGNPDAVNRSIFLSE